MKTISIIDYGIGNLLSVARAFAYFDADVHFAQTPDDIMHADRLVLPGVGAFSDGMKGLKETGFIEPIKSYSKLGKPFLGICLGMQMMLTRSHEFGAHDGLDLIEGDVVPIPTNGKDGRPHKIPHIGWNELHATEHGPNIESSILKSQNENPSVYFVHSFMAEPADPSKRLADTFYSGQPICAAIQHENIYGCQFHPEKSAETGLKIIQNFLDL